MLISLFYLHIHICSSTDEVSWPAPRCNTTNTLEGSKYVSNLNTALSILHVDASLRRFNSSEYGQSPDQVYALLQCIGNSTVNECYNCSEQAKIDVLQVCGTSIGSRFVGLVLVAGFRKISASYVLKTITLSEK